jgi:hypothetical protein
MSKKTNTQKKAQQKKLPKILLRPDKHDTELLDWAKTVTAQKSYTKAIIVLIDKHKQLHSDYANLLKKLSNLEMLHSRAMAIVEAHSTAIRLTNQFKN